MTATYYDIAVNTPTEALPVSLFQRHTLDAIDIDLGEIIKRLDRVQAQLVSAEENGYDLSGLVSAGQLLEACARARTAAFVIQAERSRSERPGGANEVFP